MLESPKNGPGERLRAACALAAYAEKDIRWQRVSRDVVARLVAEPVLEIARWAEALSPVRGYLLQPLAELLVDDNRDAAGRRMITRLYREFAKGVPECFAPLEKEAAGEIGPIDDTDARLARQRRQANRAVGLAALGRWERTREVLQEIRNKTVRSYVIDRLASGGVDAQGVEAMVFDGSDVSVRRAALLALLSLTKMLYRLESERRSARG